MMNITIWNPRGLNAPGKLICVTDLLCKNKPDIIALSETKKEDFSPAYLKSIANFHVFEWC
jgi:exonuclease III